MTDEAKPEKMGYEGKAAQAQVSLGDDLWELHSAAAKITEVTAGRTLADYDESEVLRAVVTSMLRLMEAAALRIAKHSPELASRLEQRYELHVLVERLSVETLVSDADVWRFVQDLLPGLAAGAATELDRWHED